MLVSRSFRRRHEGRADRQITRKGNPDDGVAVFQTSQPDGYVRLFCVVIPPTIIPARIKPVFKQKREGMEHIFGDGAVSPVIGLIFMVIIRNWATDRWLGPIFTAIAGNWAIYR